MVARQSEQGNVPAEFAVSPKDEYPRWICKLLTLLYQTFTADLTKKVSRPSLMWNSYFSRQRQWRAVFQWGDESTVVCTFFYGDFNREDLVAELSTLHKLYHSAVEREIPSVDIIKTALLTQYTNLWMLLSTVYKCGWAQTAACFSYWWSCQQWMWLLRGPSSTLHHIKSYLRSTMTQARLTHLMIL